MHCYPRMDRQHCRRGMSGAEGWVWYNWARQNDVGAFGTNEVPTSPGYLKREIEAVLEERKAK